MHRRNLENKERVSAAPASKHPNGLSGCATNPHILVFQAGTELLHAASCAEIFQCAAGLGTDGGIRIHEGPFHMLYRGLGVRKAHQLDGVKAQRRLVRRLLVELHEVVERIPTVEQDGIICCVSPGRIGVEKGVEEVAIACTHGVGRSRQAIDRAGA